jgi:phosphate transport system protein
MRHLQRDMEALHRGILSLSALVEEMIDKAGRALSERDGDLADEVIGSDAEVDDCEVQIEEDCLKMLALHQPVAVDLRRITTVLKVNADLERIADLAVNVAERAKNLKSHLEFSIPEMLDDMINVASDMVRGALDSFVNMDAQAARRICRLDDVVDRYNREVIEMLQARMQADPDVVAPALYCFSASRHIERIADHATNIAEDVIYLVEGEIARHHPERVHLPEQSPQ